MITQPLHILQCNSTGGDGCINHGAGHATQPIHVRVAEATPSKWADGIVLRATSDGWIGIALFGPDDTADSDTATVWVWNHADLTAHLSAGAPVALHSVYNVLASGRSRISVVRL
ncbi:hypothetical protein RCH12_002619 [Cryobacterium sp. MP_3.1]|uniref:Uncharacterized protein n=1 Tax=Cryobacterium zongtaii TaxID=1259217 RepID=A0A2S3ZC47_9MICO|nr:MULTISPECIES: hypothetical protein [Cryobacterium]MEC5185143.1 hypothetical protein [Cryobacterium sp. MP_3.1]POH63843.1 hypothetical protein C3B59_10685 [Cryobacterium zongtaii]